MCHLISIVIIHPVQTTFDYKLDRDGIPDINKIFYNMIYDLFNMLIVRQKRRSFSAGGGAARAPSARGRGRGARGARPARAAARPPPPRVPVRRAAAARAAAPATATRGTAATTPDPALRTRHVALINDDSRCSYYTLSQKHSYKKITQQLAF